MATYLEDGALPVAGGSELGLNQWPIPDITGHWERDSVTLFITNFVDYLLRRPGACNDVLKGVFTPDVKSFGKEKSR